MTTPSELHARLRACEVDREIIGDLAAKCLELRADNERLEARLSELEWIQFYVNGLLEERRDAALISLVALCMRDTSGKYQDVVEAVTSESNAFQRISQIVARQKRDEDVERHLSHLLSIEPVTKIGKLVYKHAENQGWKLEFIF